MPAVRVTWFEGKETATKQIFAVEITESIVRNSGTDPKSIYVIFEDVAPSDWAGEGKLSGSEDWSAMGGLLSGEGAFRVASCGLNEPLARYTRMAGQ